VQPLSRSLARLTVSRTSAISRRTMRLRSQSWVGIVHSAESLCRVDATRDVLLSFGNGVSAKLLRVSRGIRSDWSHALPSRDPHHFFEARRDYRSQVFSRPVILDT
jgi:hypothetical protein